MDFPKPIIIGHRGACGHLPEHTLASYALAIELGADFVEPDLVATRDGALIARHENEIGGTTDVAAKFPDRKTRKVIDGKTVEGFFAEDLTLAEVRTLRAKERLPFRDQSRNGIFPVPTFEEIIALVRQKERETGRGIGLYPETKHPSYFRSIGLPLEGRLVEILDQNGYSGPDAPVFIQSFEMANLKDLRRMTEMPLIFLLGASEARPYDFTLAGDPRTFGDLATPAALAAIAAFARGIGPWKRLIVPEESDKSLGAPTALIADAHAAGLLVHPYTFRNEERYLAPAYHNAPSAEYRHFFALGVDGVFSDFPDTAATARTLFSQRPTQPRQKV
ncbi:glycerophosphoryl diester phosphodiesterase [Solidesulfovibrio fructosivorans JJ]]|uniref:glycerophosphodiester phosphodiesterase n=1 Tax=Solidesulfovibrio fructosivorans JJ] TaxID=596151 RepID=E1JWF1_SOLFR|nr:glycerophosphodiester phosphodiesterase [Solidesulfovibrio fructosivorans]EFL51248.1 glycerophosphoryl diester phosphodiesterase [Solidesulfovibrio fructosivorans JJ]]